ncbi:uncharacterized [Tachysurus ichikawai]
MEPSEEPPRSMLCPCCVISPAGTFSFSTGCSSWVLMSSRGSILKSSIISSPHLTNCLIDHRLFCPRFHSFILNPSLITLSLLAPQITASNALVLSNLTVSSCCERDLTGDLQPKLHLVCTKTSPLLPYCGFQTHGGTHGAARLG